MTVRQGVSAELAESTYRTRTPRSAALYGQAIEAMPGGSTRATVYFSPYPPYMARGEGARITDIDGNSYLDLLNNYTSLILGHADPAVVEAVVDQVRLGSAFGAPSPVELDLAGEIESRVPSIDQLRFTNSGTEATMYALRLARAHTGREAIVRFAGAYHGTHDWVLAGTPGVPRAVADLVIELPYDDREALRAGLAGRERTIAAIIIEPVLGAGGMRPASRKFLAFLRDFSERHGIVLIFDEIIAFRVGYHGAQGFYGVTPDLTTFGKIVGGGYPLAAFGGRREIMSLTDARRSGSLVHSGTFNGSPVAAAAGLATLRHMTPDRIEALNRAGDQVRTRLNDDFRRGGVDAVVTGLGSLMNVHLGRETLEPAGRTEAQRLFHLEMLNAGYYLAPRGLAALSTPMTTSDLDGFVTSTTTVASEVLQGVNAGAARGR